MFSKLRNLGKASSKMLLSAGIRSEEQLRAMGAVSAYIAVKWTPNFRQQFKWDTVQRNG
jgi:hypothetical protein